MEHTKSTPLDPDDLQHILEHTQGLWDDLRGARLFITGGTGFFGKWLLESFVWANDRLNLKACACVLTRDIASFCDRYPHLGSNSALSFVEGELKTVHFPAGTFSHVVHAATPTQPRLYDQQPQAMSDLIVEGTRRVLDFACRSKARRFLLTSSGAVYGRQPPSITHLPEDYPGAADHLDRGSVYAEGKRIAEHLCALCYYHQGLPVTLARSFAFVGPYLPLDAHFAIGNFIRDGLRGGPIRVLGDGTPYRSYLHAADLAIWLWTILLRGQPCRPYNVGSDRDLSIGALAQLVAKTFGTRVEILQTPQPGASPARYVPSTRRAEQELGLKTWIPLEDAIARTARWHRDVK